MNEWMMTNRLIGYWENRFLAVVVIELLESVYCYVLSRLYCFSWIELNYLVSLLRPLDVSAVPVEINIITLRRRLEIGSSFSHSFCLWCIALLLRPRILFSKSYVLLALRQRNFKLGLSFGGWLRSFFARFLKWNLKFFLSRWCQINKSHSLAPLTLSTSAMTHN